MDDRHRYRGRTDRASLGDPWSEEGSEGDEKDSAPSAVHRFRDRCNDGGRAVPHVPVVLARSRAKEKQVR